MGIDGFEAHQWIPGAATGHSSRALGSQTWLHMYQAYLSHFIYLYRLPHPIGNQV